MIVTITTTHRPATDLGFLLMKHPDNVHAVDLPFGRATLFYPEADEARCTAAIALEVDAVELVRGKGRIEDQYVTDRPYAASSLLSVALGRLLGTAMGGRSRDRQALADTPLPLEATVTPLPARGTADLLARLFEPLGYSVAAEAIPLDPAHPEWGDSPYVALKLAGEVRLAALLTHLFVLIPVLDNAKHYYVGEAEVEKLLRKGEGWLEAHQVVYGHTPVLEANWVNGTICIDTGCVFGGKLTALRYPELDLVEVPAARTWYEPVRPLQAPPADTGGAESLQLDLADVLGKQAIQTRLSGIVTIREENGAAALEVMSRHAVDPRWLIHLPPTMSPAETSSAEGWLERPEEAFAYYGTKGVRTLVAEEKHMGSRGLILLARTQEAAARRFGVHDGARGIVVTRTGRRFFADAAVEAAALHRIDAAMDAAGLWTELGSDWALWDAEIMPWSMKAGALVRGQYAAVGAAAVAGLGALSDALAAALARGVPVEALAETTEARLDDARRYRAAYNRYVAPFAGIEDLRIAPFHLLASEGAVHDGKDHLWHMGAAHRLAAADPALLVATRYRRIDLDDATAVTAATTWWEEMTEAGGEGMVVKPLGFVARGSRGLLQPAIKCRGREYLRIIYGPDYDRPDNLARLRKRGLGQKRSMALREFALGLEALHRFVEHAPLTRVHQCVFGVLAMESEPVDPRL